MLASAESKELFLQLIKIKSVPAVHDCERCPCVSTEGRLSCICVCICIGFVLYLYLHLYLYLYLLLSESMVCICIGR